MPRETIRRLSESTERLLVAGAHLAQGSSELAGDKAALQKLIEKLGSKAPPVFGRLVEQIDRTLAAKPKEQAAELITLAASLAQVRGGLAQSAAVVDERPLDRAHEVETPCNAKDLYALHDALVSSGHGRMEKINDALQRGDVGDLRLVHAVIQAMGDPYLGDAVSDKVVPAFGRAIVEPVRAKLRFPGKKVDGRRLRALVAVEKVGARDMIDRAIEEGSAEVRAAALDAVADYLPGVPELEPVILSILATDRSGEVRRAAIRALAGYRGDASLEQLLGSLDDERTAREASEALGKSRHPQVVERLLSRLEAAVAAGHVKVKKDDAPAAKARDAARALVRRVLSALSELDDPRIPRVARKLLADYGTAAAAAVVARGDVDDLRAVADLLLGKDEEVFVVAVLATIKLPADEAFQRLNALFEAKDRDSKVGTARLVALRRANVVVTGERWVKALLQHVKASPPPHGAVALLGATGDPRAVEPLIALLEKAKAKEAVVELVNALAALGDSRAMPVILQRLRADDWQIFWAVRSSIIALADASTVGVVRDAFATLENPDAPNSWGLRYLLRDLERKFPGY